MATMATQLKNIVAFGVPTPVAVGQTVSLPHGLTISPPGGGDLPQTPDLVLPERSGFTVTADDINVTVTNNTSAAATIRVYVETWHSIERAFGAQSILELVPRPFVVDLDAGVAGLGAVIGFGAGNLAVSADAVDNLWPWFDQDQPDAEGGSLEMVMPRAGTLRNLYVRNNFAGTAGAVSYTVTKNGVLTPLTVANLNSGAAGQGSNLVNAVFVVAGDFIGMKATIGEAGGGGACGAVATMLFDD